MQYLTPPQTLGKSIGKPLIEFCEAHGYLKTHQPNRHKLLDDAFHSLSGSYFVEHLKF